MTPEELAIQFCKNLGRDIAALIRSAVAEEREACAKIIDEMSDPPKYVLSWCCEKELDRAAQAIRNRSN